MNVNLNSALDSFYNSFQHRQEKEYKENLRVKIELEKQKELLKPIRNLFHRFIAMELKVKNAKCNSLSGVKNELPQDLFFQPVLFFPEPDRVAILLFHPTKIEITVNKYVKEQERIYFVTVSDAERFPFGKAIEGKFDNVEILLTGLANFFGANGFKV